MGDELVIVPSDGDGYLELAKHRQGRLFKKHLLTKGKLVHPKVGEVTIDDEFLSKIKKNFDDGVCPIVQVPLANAKNEHSEEPDRNIGEVVDVQIDGDKLYAVMDIRDPEHASRMGKTYLGASAMLSLDYTNTKTQESVGPTLLHSCVTNRPYVIDLDDYEEVVAATSDRSNEPVVLLTETQTVEKETAKETEMPDDTTETVAEPSLDELLATLKSKHNIDVAALQQAQLDTDKQAQLSQTIVDALKNAGVVQLTNTDDKVADDTVITAVKELATNNVALTNRLSTLERRDAEHAVDSLIATGHILPAKREVMVTLKLSNTELFDQLVPESPIVKLSAEVGKNPPKAKEHELDIDAEIARYSAMIPGRK